MIDTTQFNKILNRILETQHIITEFSITNIGDKTWAEIPQSVHDEIAKYRKILLDRCDELESAYKIAVEKIEENKEKASYYDMT